MWLHGWHQVVVVHICGVIQMPVYGFLHTLIFYLTQLFPDNWMAHVTWKGLMWKPSWKEYFFLQRDSINTKLSVQHVLVEESKQLVFVKQRQLVRSCQGACSMLTLWYNMCPMVQKPTIYIFNNMAHRIRTYHPTTYPWSAPYQLYPHSDFPPHSLTPPPSMWRLPSQSQLQPVYVLYIRTLPLKNIPSHTTTPLTILYKLPPTFTGIEHSMGHSLKHWFRYNLPQTLPSKLQYIQAPSQPSRFLTLFIWKRYDFKWTI